MPFDDTMFIKRNVDVLSYFTDDQIRTITQDIDRQVYKKGQTVVFQGEINTNFHIIKRGRVEVLAKGGSEKVKLAELGAGDFFGEMSLLDSGTANATIRSLEDDTVILMVPLDVFKHFLRQNPALELALREKVAERQRQRAARMTPKSPPTAAPPEGSL